MGSLEHYERMTDSAYHDWQLVWTECAAVRCMGTIQSCLEQCRAHW